MKLIIQCFAFLVYLTTRSECGNFVLHSPIEVDTSNGFQDHVEDSTQCLQELKSVASACDYSMETSIHLKKSEKHSKCLGCQIPFILVGNKCFLIGKVKLNYDRSTSFCSSFHAHLAEPSTPHLLAQFKMFLKESLPPGDAVYWISVTARNDQNVWKWLDGTTLEADDRLYWKNGEPQRRTATEVCAITLYTSQWLLHDTECGSHFIPICEYTAK